MSELERLTKLVNGAATNKNFEALLGTLLAAVHRDGGQYTTLAGLTTSVVDALLIVDALHKDNAALKARLYKVTRG